MIGWLVGQLVGLLVGWLIGWLVGWWVCESLFIEEGRKVGRYLCVLDRKVSWHMFGGNEKFYRILLSIAPYNVKIKTTYFPNSSLG